MLNKALRLAAIGFVLGMTAGCIIGAVISVMTEGTLHVYSGALLSKAGSAAAATAIQMLLSGVLGAVSMSGVVLYELDWNMIKVAVVHYLMIAVSFFVIGAFLGWYTPSVPRILLIAALFAAWYFIVWLTIYLRYRAEVKKLNKLIK